MSGKPETDWIEREYEAWFARLQALTNAKLDPAAYFGRWFDYFTPEEALEAGPETDDD